VIGKKYERESAGVGLQRMSEAKKIIFSCQVHEKLPEKLDNNYFHSNNISIF